jgi:hypothetical protein
MTWTVAPRVLPVAVWSALTSRACTGPGRHAEVDQAAR